MDPLLDLCRRLVDPSAEPVAEHAGHNGTRVLRAVTRRGEVIVKVHRSDERHEQELHAYRTWVGKLGDLAPTLVAESDDPPAIVVTALPGRNLADLELDPDAERDTYRQAGALLRTMHQAGPPREQPDMTNWLADRGEQWLSLAHDLLPADHLASIRSHLRALRDLGPIPAVPCHLDFTPRNLVLGPDCAVRLIDYEHARYDLAARDLVRLATRVWQQRRDLRDAFLSTYGELNALDIEVIGHASYLDQLTAIVSASGKSPTSQNRSCVV